MHIVLPLRNIGSGPALNVEIAVTPRNAAGQRSQAWGDARHTTWLVGLGLGEDAAVVIPIGKLGDLPSFDIWIDYTDVAKKPWQTFAKFLARDEGGAYRGMSISSPVRDAAGTES